MGKYKLLTDGGYEELKNCVGKTLEGRRISETGGLIHISVAELLKNGKEEEKEEDVVFDNYYFFINREVEEIKPQREKTTNE